jgi:hypothetical protein
MPEVLNTLYIKTTVLCDTMPYGLVQRYYLGGICCLQLQQRMSLKMRAIGSFATLAFT